MAAAGWTRLVIVADDIITVIVQPMFDSKKPTHEPPWNINIKKVKYDARAEKSTGESRNLQCLSWGVLRDYEDAKKSKTIKTTWVADVSVITRRKVHVCCIRDGVYCLIFL